MEKYFLGISIILAASIYAYTQRYSLVETEENRTSFVLRYDSWTQEFCTLNNTKTTRSIAEYIPVICE
jgi:hypothetical protein